jgi:uncharacterized membrane protein YfcA
MWLGLVLVILVILVLLGGLVAGGVYAAVLIPIAAIILISSLVITMWRRSNDPEARHGPAGSVGWPPPVNTSTGSGVNDPKAPDTPDEALKRRQG